MRNELINSDVESHILIPKCILKQFQDSANTIYYYEVADKKVKLGRSDKLNTKHGYYSHHVEKFLSDNIESPLGRVLKKLNESYQKYLTVSCLDIYLSIKDLDCIKRYVYSLLARSPSALTCVKNGFVFERFYAQQSIRDMTVYDMCRLIEEQPFLEEYQMSIIFCRNNDEFVLPMQGIVDYMFCQTEMWTVPLTNKICVNFSKGQYNFDKFYFSTTDFVNKVNSFAFEQQCGKGYGFIASSQKSIIEDLVKSNFLYSKR